jgi:hypothetical protein
LPDLFSKYRAGEIRTRDLLNPIQAHYQAVLRPDTEYMSFYGLPRALKMSQFPVTLPKMSHKNGTATDP